MLLKKFQLDISYGQISVFLSTIPQPFNDWTQAHVEQGFAWRLGSVSFATLLEAGKFTIDVLVTDNTENYSNDFIRAIEVPFVIPENEQVEIASIADSLKISVPSGKYILKYELLLREHATEGQIRLIFKKSEALHFSVQREDKKLILQENLLTTANPAS